MSVRVCDVGRVVLSLSCLILSLSPEEGDQDIKEKEEEEEDGGLDRQKCQAALTSLRHAKWFQVGKVELMTKSFRLEIYSLFDLEHVSGRVMRICVNIFTETARVVLDDTTGGRHVEEEETPKSLLIPCRLL